MVFPQLQIFYKIFHKKIYDYEARDIKTPSTAVAHRKKIIPIKDFIEEIMKNAEQILKSWGFTSNEFNIIS
ncbi:hypothetical protein ES703_94144 [subsurface metagenome]